MNNHGVLKPRGSAMLLWPPRQDRKVTFTIKNLIVQETLNFGRRPASLIRDRCSERSDWHTLSPIFSYADLRILMGIMKLKISGFNANSGGVHKGPDWQILGPSARNTESHLGDDPE